MGYNQAMDNNAVVDNKQPAPKRPWQHRLLHTIGEVLLSFLFAGGLLMTSMKVACMPKYSCQDMSAVGYLIPFLIVTIVLWSWFLSLCKKLRDRLPARKKLDISTAVVTVILWLVFFLLQ